MMTNNTSKTKEAFFYKLRILVTGGAGFIGSHLVDALLPLESDVSVVDNLQSGSWNNLVGFDSKMTQVEADVRDYATLERIITEFQPAVIFHLAANASVPGSVDQPRYDFETNCGATFSLLDILRRVKPDTRVVFSSSAAVYGEPKELPISETSPLVPISPYGASKLAAEEECRIFHHVYGLPVIVARVFNTYGPRMPRFVILDFLKKLNQDVSRLTIMGNGTQVRDFNFVSDTVAGLITLAMQGTPGQSYNLASGHSCSITELARGLLDVLNLRDKTRLEYTGKSWVGDAQHWEVNISKISELGYSPAVPLEDGLRQVVAWFTKINSDTKF